MLHPPSQSPYQTQTQTQTSTSAYSLSTNTNTYHIDAVINVNYNNWQNNVDNVLEQQHQQQQQRLSYENRSDTKNINNQQINKYNESNNIFEHKMNLNDPNVFYFDPLALTSNKSNYYDNGNSSANMNATTTLTTNRLYSTYNFRNDSITLEDFDANNSSSSSSSSSIATHNSSIIYNNNNNNSNNTNDMLITIETIGNILSFYYVPILVCTGSIGNILSVFVFFKTKLRKLSSSFYLAALAVSDTCFLFGLFAQWLNFIDVNVYNRDFCCQFFTFFSSLASFCSAWFVVAFTVERFIAVMYPLKRQTMCTVRRAKIVLLGLTTVGCVHCAPFWISSTTVYSPKLEATLCDIKSEYKEYITLLNYWDTFVVFAVPFTTIAILNTFTGCTVWKFATVRRSLTMQRRRTHLKRGDLSTSTYHITSIKRQQKTAGVSTCAHASAQSSVSLEHCSHSSRKSSRRKLSNSSQLKVTKMLLTVSTVFVCLNLPSCVMRIKTYLETQTSANEKTTVVLQYIFQLLFITNFGINFVLYCVSGQNFRKAVLSMFRRVSASAQREPATQVTVSEYCRNSGGTSTSTRRRMMTQQCWNEIHELQLLK